MTDYISAYSQSGHLFIPRLFQGFPEIKEALMSNRMQAAFMVAPMAIALRAQGVPVKIVYLGHRYGSAVVVRSDGDVRSVPDLRGKTIAIPSRFSDERLIVFKALKDNGMSAKDVHMVEMAPPDVPGALAAGAVDAFSMGEPFPSQAEMAKYGRVLFHARQYWPDYISCVLVVRQDTIEKRAEAVQELVDGVARSGLWLEDGERKRAHREHAAVRRPLLLPAGPEAAALGAAQPHRPRAVRAALPTPRRLRVHRTDDGGDEGARQADRLQRVR